MQSLDVQVDQSAVEQLFQVLRSLEPSPNRGLDPSGINQEIATYPSSEEVEFVRQEFEPETVLASYDHMGKEQLFRAEDYFNWFKTIPCRRLDHERWLRWEGHLEIRSFTKQEMPKT